MHAHRTHLFIVDDDKAFGRSLQRLMNAREFDVDLFGSAAAFLDSVPSDQNGIAIVDIHMRLCDGFSLMAKMRELHYTMPVILITGMTEPGSRDMAIERGAVGFLQKPFSDQALLELIEAQEQEKDDR